MSSINNISGGSWAAQMGSFFRAPVQTAAEKELAEKADAAQKAFTDYVNKPLNEKLRAQILGSMGLTEDSLKGMAPEEREKIEKKIAEKIKEMIENDLRKKVNGRNIDILA